MYPKQRRQRTYVCSQGCPTSWIWADRINADRWKCDKCNQAWPQTTWVSDQSQFPKRRNRPRRDRNVLVERPPGLGHRPQISGVEKALQKGWSSLSKEVQEALKVVGIDYTPEPELQSIEEILKAHIEALPKEVKEAVETLVAPVKQEPKDVTTQLKTTVGELRQLSNKKAGLQKRVDHAKDQYKTLLEELKLVQEQIDKEQKQLSAQSEAYAKLLKEETVVAADEGQEAVVDADVNEHVLKALARVGILYTDSQRTDLERQLAENMLKRRKKGEGQPSG